MTKVAYFNCSYGASGDMLLASLIDAGLSLSNLKTELKKLPIKLPTISTKSVESHHITGSKLVLGKNTDHKLRKFTDLISIIESSNLENPIKANAIKVLTTLGKTEAKIHKCQLNEVTFHELGGIDTILDIVGFSAAINLMKIQLIFFGTIPIGDGVKTDFGNPAPAVLELCKNITVKGVPITAELITPTAAAILVSLGKQRALPEALLDTYGYGFGNFEFNSHPNCVQVIIANQPSNYHLTNVVVLETNLDDITGEQLGFTGEKLIEHGALDYFIMPTTGKKSRPGYLLTVICNESVEQKLVEVMFSMTSTLGIRRRVQERYEAIRTTKNVKLRGAVIRIKFSPYGYKPEFEDIKRLSEKSRIPLKQLIKELEAIISN